MMLIRDCHDIIFVLDIFESAAPPTRHYDFLPPGLKLEEEEEDEDTHVIIQDSDEEDNDDDEGEECLLEGLVLSDIPSEPRWFTIDDDDSHALLDTVLEHGHDIIQRSLWVRHSSWKVTLWGRLYAKCRSISERYICSAYSGKSKSSVLTVRIVSMLSEHFVFCRYKTVRFQLLSKPA